jgi:hypothetical protein
VVSFPALPDDPSTSPATPTLGAFPGVAAGTPGLYPGALSAPLPAINGLGGIAVSVYALLASSVSADVSDDGGLGVGPDGGAQESCVALVGPRGQGTSDSPPGRLVAGRDFFAVGTMPAGTFSDGASYLVALTGCLGGSGAAAACGNGYDGGTNVALGVARLDTTTVIDGGVGAQFAPRSTALEGEVLLDDAGGVLHAAATSGVIPVFVIDGGIVPLAAADAGLFFGASTLFPATVASVMVDPASASASFGVLLVPTDGGAPSTQPYPSGDLFSSPLASIAALSAWPTWSTTSSGFGAASYTFVLVGDPFAPPPQTLAADGGGAPNPAYDGRGLHFVAVPNRFAPRAN